METPAAHGLVTVASVASLRARLLRVPGVADAQVEGPDDEPSTVRVRLENGADGQVVQSGVQRVLADRGLRARLAPPRLRLQQLPPPPPPPSMEDEWSSGPPPVPPHGAERTSTPPPGWKRNLSLPDTTTIEERADRVRVTVADRAGRGVTREGPPSRRGAEEAIVQAAAALAAPARPAPLLVSVRRDDHGGHAVITVLLDVGDGVRAGASVIRADHNLALARAAWTAVGLEG